MNGVFKMYKPFKTKTKTNTKTNTKTKTKRNSKTCLLCRAVLPLLLMLCGQSQANAPERVVWDKHPIAVALSVGQERLIHFPNDVRYWLPDYLNNAVTVLAVNGVLYVTAHREFETTRIRVQSLNDQTMYLLDLSTSIEQTPATELIVMKAALTVNQAKSDSSENNLADNNPTSVPAFDWFIRLTRYAAQSLYAQERLLPSDRDIREVRLAEPVPIPLIRGGHIRATPIKSWRGGGYYLTAVKLQNVSVHAIPIIHATHNHQDPQGALILSRDLRGDWLAVTPQHSTLGAHPYQDVTTLYLLSQRSFRESLQ